MKRGVSKRFAKFTGKHLCQSLFFNFIKKETLAHVLFCGFCKRCNNYFLTEQLWTTFSQTNWPFAEI